MFRTTQGIGGSEDGPTDVEIPMGGGGVKLLNGPTDSVLSPFDKTENVLSGHHLRIPLPSAAPLCPCRRDTSVGGGRSRSNPRGRSFEGFGRPGLKQTHKIHPY